MLEVEYLRIFIRLVRANHKLRIIEDDFIHNDLQLAMMLRLRSALLPHGLRRNTDRQPLHVDGAYVGWLEEQANQPGMKFKLLNGNKRSLRPGGHHVIGREDAQAFPRNCQPLDERNLQVIQLHMAVEAGAESFDDPAFEDRFGSLEHDFGHKHEHEHSNKSDPGDPSPAIVSSRTLRLWILAYVVLDRTQNGRLIMGCQSAKVSFRQAKNRPIFGRVNLIPCSSERARRIRRDCDWHRRRRRNPGFAPCAGGQEHPYPRARPLSAAGEA